MAWTRVWVRARLWLGVLLCASACTDRTSDLPLHEGVGDRPRSDECDITRRACQQAVLDATLAVRGGELALPDIYVVTPEEFVEQLTAGIDPEDLEPSDSNWLRALAHFDLMPSNWSNDDDLDQLAAGVAAAYFHEGDFIVVLDHGGSMSGPEALFTLSHEFVHALQDAEHDLGALNEDFVEASTDEYLAMLGLVEGEAVLYSMLATFESPPESPAQWGRFFDMYLPALEDEALNGPAPYASASLVFPYGHGARFVVDHYLEGGDDAIDALFRDVPDSTREVLAPFGANEPRRGWNEPIGEVVPLQVPEGFEVVAQDELGAWLFEVYLERGDLGGAARLGGALRGDRFASLSNGADVVGVWALRFAEADALDALAALDALRPRTYAELRGTEDVLVFAGLAADELAEFAAGFAWPPPPTTSAQRRAPLPFGRAHTVSRLPSLGLRAQVRD